METKKNPERDIDRRRTGLLQLGLISGLALCLSAFEYTSFSYQQDEVAGIEIDMIEEPKIYVPEPPEPEKPKPEQKETRNNTNSSSQQVQVATEITVTSDPSDPNIALLPNDGQIVIPASTEEPVLEKEFVIVEDMPYYKEFEKIRNKEKRIMASDAQMIRNIHKKIKYPAMARELGIKGTVHVSFRVNKKGEVEDVQILKSVHPDLDEEAIRVVKLLPSMVPGKQRGEIVNVRYMIPIKFQLR